MKTTGSPLAHSHAMRWVLAYDIRDQKRLQRVGRYMQKAGMRLQYSVFVVHGSRAQVEKVMAELSNLIDESNDDVRVYPLTESTRIWGLGNQFRDDGNTLSDKLMDKFIILGKSATMNEQSEAMLSFSK
jgi:CRISPR-associated protein Cas2